MNESDFAGIANQPNVADPYQGADELARVNEQITKQLNNQPAPHPLDQLRDMGARFAVQSEQAKLTGTPPFGSLTFKSDGTVDASGVPADVLQDLMESRDFHRQALGGFAQQAQQIQTELQRAQSQPWQQLGTALAANMANQPGMPPWVRGLGQTAAQMNPTVDQLRAQYLGVMGKGAEIAEKGAAIDIAQKRTVIDKLEHDERVAERTAYHKGLEETRKAETQRKTVGDYLDLAKAGRAPAREALDKAEKAGLLPVGGAELVEATNKSATLTIEQQNKVRSELQKQKDAAAGSRASIIALSAKSRAGDITPKQAEANYASMLSHVDVMKRSRDFKVSTIQQNIFLTPEEKTRLEEEIRGDDTQIRAAEEELTFQKARLSAIRGLKEPPTKKEPTTSEKARARLKVLRGPDLTGSKQLKAPAESGIRDYTNLPPPK